MKPLKIFIKIFFWLFVSSILAVASLIVIAAVYEDEIKQQVITELNKKLTAEVKVKNIDFSILKNFPQASIIFTDVKIKSAPYEGSEKNPFWKRNLIDAEQLSLQFNVLDIISENYKIKKVHVTNATLNLLTAKNKKTNYDIVKKDSVTTSSDNVSFNLNSVLLSNVKINYYEPTLGNSIELKVLESNLKGDFFNSDYTLQNNGKFYLNELQLNHVEWLKNKTIKTNFNLDVKNNSEFTFNNSNFSIEQLSFIIDGVFKTIENKNSYIDYSIKADNINIENLISLLPQQYSAQANEYKGNGKLNLDVLIKGEISDTKNPIIKSTFSIQNGSLTHIESNIQLKNISFNGELNSLENTNNGNNFFKIENFSSNLGNGNINGSILVTDFSNPTIHLKSKTDINVDEFLQFLSIDTIENPSGKLNFSLEYLGKLESASQLNEFNLKDENLVGEILLEDVNFNFKNGRLAFTGISSKITSNKSDVTLNYLKGKVGSSDFNLEGELTNLLSFLFKENESLKVDAKLNSTTIDLTEILSNKEESSKSDTSFKLHLSDKFDVNLMCNVEHLIFKNFKANDLTGKFILLDKQIKLNQIYFNAMAGNVTAEAVINGKDDDFFEVKCSANLNEIDMPQLMFQLNNFGQEDLTEKNIKGKLNSTIAFYSKWNSNLTCITKTINSTASIKISNGELKNYTPLQSLSRFISVDELNNIKFSELENTIAIKDRLITIPGMLIKSSVLDVSVSGTHSFDNILAYHFKLKMNDLLFRKTKAKKQDIEDFAEEDESDGKKGMNLYISMSGPIDDLKIKYDKQGFKKSFKEIKSEEKNTVKSLLNEEFGWFKNKTTTTKPEPKKQKEPTIEWEETKKIDDKKTNELPKVQNETKSKLIDKKKNPKKEKTENADDFN